MCWHGQLPETAANCFFLHLMTNAILASCWRALVIGHWCFLFFPGFVPLTRSPLCFELLVIFEYCYILCSPVTLSVHRVDSILSALLKFCQHGKVHGFGCCLTESLICPGVSNCLFITLGVFNCLEASV